MTVVFVLVGVWVPGKVLVVVGVGRIVVIDVVTVGRVEVGGSVGRDGDVVGRVPVMVTVGRVNVLSVGRVKVVGVIVTVGRVKVSVGRGPVMVIVGRVYVVSEVGRVPPGFVMVTVGRVVGGNVKVVRVLLSLGPRSSPAPAPAGWSGLAERVRLVLRAANRARLARRQGR